LAGISDSDEIRGGKGDDRLIGGEGNDLLNGGPGEDVFMGGPGADDIRAKDSARDSVNCGDGNSDRATVDPGDTVVWCETVKVIL
jgi:Ca2+-binding RTX toxin-like protein